MSLLQVASYSISSFPSLRIFQQETAANAPSLNLLVAEPLLQWERDEQGRPTMKSMQRSSDGATVFELRLVLSTAESQEAAQRVIKSNPVLERMTLTTQVDFVNLEAITDLCGLEMQRGELYPSRVGNSNMILVDIVSRSLTTSESDFAKFRSTLESLRLRCKAVANGLSLPWVTLDFSAVTPPAAPAAGGVFGDILAKAAAAAGVSVPAAAAAAAPVVIPQRTVLAVPHSPRTVGVPFGCVFRLAVTSTGNLVATTNDGFFSLLDKNGGLIRKVIIGSRTAGVAVYKGHIFVTDRGTHRIHVFDEAGEFVRTMGSGPGDNRGDLNSPAGVAISKKTGRLYVTNAGKHRVQVYDDCGVFLFQFGEYGRAHGHLMTPYGIDIDSNDNVYITENEGNRISVFNAAGEFQRLFCREGTLPGQLKQPDQLFVDASGSILVAEFGNQRIQIFNRDGILERFFSLGIPSTAVTVDNEGKVVVGSFSRCTLLIYNN